MEKKRCIMPIKWIFKLAIRQNKFKNDENAKKNNIGIGVDRAMCWCSLVYSIFIHVESPFFILRPHRKISYWLSDLNWRWNNVEKKMNLGYRCALYTYASLENTAYARWWQQATHTIPTTKMMMMIIRLIEAVIVAKRSDDVIWVNEDTSSR